MNATWVTLAAVSVVGLTKLLTWLLGKPRKIEQLKHERQDLENKLRDALERNDTVAISVITIDLERVRKALNDLNAK